MVRDLPCGRFNRVDTPEEVERGSPLFFDMVEDAQEYSAADSERACEEAAWVVALAGEVIGHLGTSLH